MIKIKLTWYDASTWPPQEAPEYSEYGSRADLVQKTKCAMLLSFDGEQHKFVRVGDGFWQDVDNDGPYVCRIVRCGKHTVCLPHRRNLGKPKNSLTAVV